MANEIRELSDHELEVVTAGSRSEVLFHMSQAKEDFLDGNLLGAMKNVAEAAHITAQDKYVPN